MQKMKGTVSHFQLLAPLGAGGMGQVHTALDTKLNRTVVLKFVSPELVQDPSARQRLLREARTAATLNHTNICTIHEIGEVQPQEELKFGTGEDVPPGTPFIAMELIEGRSLEALLSETGPPSLDEFFSIAIQIAEGLEAAHQHGLVHRDLKPANLQLTPDGTIKILDFGLARDDRKQPAASDDGDEVPTVSLALTQTGAILGTPGYMSPEQVRGGQADWRSDIWAFGCVLYELLTGQRAFPGQTVQDRMASILEHEPDWTLLPKWLPRSIRQMLQRTLVKEVNNRLQSIGDARIAIQEYLGDPSQDEEERTRRSVWSLAPWILLPLIAAAGAWFLKPVEAPLPTLQVDVSMPDGMWTRSPRHQKHIAISPDGQALAFVAGTLAEDQAVTRGGNYLDDARLYLRQLDLRQSRPIPGVGGCDWPVFSPDGRWLAFTTYGGGSELKKVDLNGGEPISLWKTRSTVGVVGASWGPDGKIAIGSYNAGLLTIPAGGGEPDTLTWLDKDAGEHSHRLPHFLPDGRTVLFTAVSHHLDVINWDRDARIYAFSLDTGKKSLLIEGGSDARYLQSGHIVFARDGQLMAVRFDEESLAVSGAPIQVLDFVGHCINSNWSGNESGAAQFDVSSTGLLAYIPGPLQANSPKEVVWVDRGGNEESIAVPPSNYIQSRISPDGRQLLLTGGDRHLNVWTFDLERESMRRQTFEGKQLYAEWGPGADQITFDSDIEGPRALFTKVLDSGPGNTQKLWSGPYLAGPTSRVLQQGKVAFVQEDPEGYRILIASMDSQTEVFPGSGVLYPAFSPDGRWLAYSSAQSGRPEVYVRHYPDDGREVLISTDSGRAPVWSHDGTEIFYKVLKGREVLILAASIEVVDNRLRPGKPQELFRGLYKTALPTRSYDVGADGRFLMMKNPPDSILLNLRDERVFDHIRLVQNWFAEIEAKLQDSQ